MEKSNQPLVSVVIPCYNHEQFVQDCIQSVIDQTYENIELIIIDDGSKDHSVESIQKMVSKCEERFVRFEFRSRPNKGLSATLNEALEWCQGKYYSAIASDDQFVETKTATQVDYLENNINVVAVLGAVYWVDNFNKIINKKFFKEKKYSFKEIFLLEHNLNVCTQMARLNIIKNVGGYKDGFLVEDWYMWLKLTEKGEIVNLPHFFTKYRKHEFNTINNGYIIYTGLMQTVFEYKDHYLYFRSLKKIIWLYVASLILVDRKKGWLYFNNLFFSDISSIFSKNFYRCIRNFLISKG